MDIRIFQRRHLYPTYPQALSPPENEKQSLSTNLHWWSVWCTKSLKTACQLWYKGTNIKTPFLNIVFSQNWRTLSWRRIRCLTAGGAGWPPGGSSLLPRRRCSLSRTSWRTEVSPRPRRVSTHIERDIGHWQGQKTCWLPVAAPSYDELCPGAVVGTGCQLWNWCILLCSTIFGEGT